MRLRHHGGDAPLTSAACAGCLDAVPVRGCSLPLWSLMAEAQAADRTRYVLGAPISALAWGQGLRLLR